ncbi:MAG TPA: dimethyl sulfoxide reductase anchor subunit [Rubrivivax sp.]|nr:dimethyl sulfoxide reductase anchor subunit [Rubrivivax sp.]
MNPAFSVILLTTLIGAGQGLFLALVTVQSHAVFGLLPAAAGGALYVPGSLSALLLLVAGLGASFFHLGRPERAWRSAAMWRTSWLSREVIVLPVFMAVVALYLVLQLAGADRDDTDFRNRMNAFSVVTGIAVLVAVFIGALGTLLAFALFVCTGMIYACLRFLAEWSTPLTPLNFTLMGGASGFTVAAALAAALEPALVPFLAGWALVLTLLAGIGRLASLVRNARLRPRSTLQTAIGVKHPQVVQRSMGFMGGSFNTREFFHHARPATLRAVKPVFLLLAFVLPLGLLAAGRAEFQATAMLASAAVVQGLGLVAERWFFFAQARHPQNLYYQAVS